MIWLLLAAGGDHLDETKSSTRYALLDALRGLALVSMIAYHAAWDATYLFGMDWPWFDSIAVDLWQQATGCAFILLSGFCQPLSRHALKRGAVVFVAGMLITGVTLVVMPQDRVVFGVLTLIGSCMVLVRLADPLLRRCNAVVGLVASLLLFVLTKGARHGYLGVGDLVLLELPDALYANLLTTYLGFPELGFYSTDYYGLIPWGFLFVAGYFLHCLVRDRGLLPHLLPSVSRPLEWLGRRSLVVYLVHQPTLYALLWAVFALLARTAG